MKECYIHSVRRLLECPAKEKERLLSRLNSVITTYLEDVPEANETDLVSNFGTPEDCAARLLNECSPATVTTVRKRRNRHYRILSTVLAVLLTIVMGISAYLYLNGGLVIIRMGNAVPEYVKDLQRNQITYNYDD